MLFLQSATKNTVKQGYAICGVRCENLWPAGMIASVARDVSLVALNDKSIAYISKD